MNRQRTFSFQPSRVTGLAILLLSLALAASAPLHAQTYSDLYNFGGVTGDPANPQHTGEITQGRDGDLWTTVPVGGSVCCGDAFKVSSPGALTSIYSFTESTAAPSFPYGGLMLGTDGNFYGTTKGGGKFNLGTLFKLSSSGTLTPLYSFGTCTYPCKEGAYPASPPIQGMDGNYYGTTPYTTDGTNDGVVYKLTSAGKYSTLYAFDGTRGYNPQAALIQGTDGNLYGTTASGGVSVSPSCWDSSLTCGTVFKITTGGTITTIYKFDQTHGAGPLGPLIQGTDGNFYGTTSAGGTKGLGVVFKLTSAGVITVLHDFIGSDGETPQAGLVQANDGNFYGVASAGGSLGYGTIFKLTSTSDHTFSVVHDFDQTHGQTPEVALFQNTNGILYGNTYQGGKNGRGVFYSLDINAAEFAKLQTTSGKVGTTVSILGQSFTGAKAVSFGGVNATAFKVVSDNYMTANVPTGGKTGTVTVTRASGALDSIQQFKITPTIHSISPTSGPIGTVVTINGSGLIQTTKVTIGGAKVTAFSVDSDSKVTATVPSGAKTGKISVTTAGGSATSSTTFTVTP
jgi:uncharacterized repeat protein (TIGR03803 family)